MRRIIEHKGIQWIDLQDPTPQDIQYLKGRFQFHPLVFDQLIPDSWGTKVEHFPSHLFLVLFFPVYNKERRETRGRELDIVVTKDALITSHYNSLLPLKRLFDLCNLYEEERERSMGQGSGLLMHNLLHLMWEDCGLKIRKVGKKLEGIEESIFKGQEREMLREISVAKADIINLWRIIRPQKGVVTSLRDMAPEFFGTEIFPYFSHLRNHWARTMSNLFAHKEMIEALEDTNNALLSYKTNEIMRVLTVFAVIFLPLTLFSQIFGMNTTYLPFMGKAYDFWVVMGGIATLFFATFLYFKQKRWL